MNERVNATFVPAPSKNSFIVATWTAYAVAPTVKNRANLTCVSRSLSLALNIHDTE